MEKAKIYYIFNLYERFIFQITFKLSNSYDIKSFFKFPLIFVKTINYSKI